MYWIGDLRKIGESEILKKRFVTRATIGSKEINPKS